MTRVRRLLCRALGCQPIPDGSGICYCGQMMDNHSLYDNHAATEMMRERCRRCGQ